MTFHYKLTEEDYIIFNLFHFNNSSSSKRQQLMQKMIIPIIFAVICVLYIVYAKPESVIAPILICSLGALVWVLANPLLAERSLKKQVKKMMDEGKRDELVGDYIMTISEDGIREENHQRDVKSSFDSIEKITMDEKHLYIYNSPMSAFMIPHTAFESTKQEDETVSYIKEKAGL